MVKSYDAELVGADPDADVAVLKIDAPAEELYPVPIGTSDNLQVGQRVYTLGNPFGLEGTLTTGIISNLNRTLPSRTGREMKSIIQTDAAMNPGNSGGPLLDTSGRMIGMNVAIATKTGQSAGVGFAIPINRIRQIVPQLIEHGKVVRADIGIIAVNEMDQGLQIVQAKPRRAGGTGRSAWLEAGSTKRAARAARLHRRTGRPQRGRYHRGRRRATCGKCKRLRREDRRASAGRPGCTDDYSRGAATQRADHSGVNLNRDLNSQA